MSVGVRWADGATESAESWGELLRRVGTSRWERTSKLEAKRELRRRAARWSGTLIRADGVGVAEFFDELQRAGLLEVMWDDDAGETRDG